MRILALIPGVLLIVLPLVDAFETILQPRRVTHRYRFARFYYRSTWAGWRCAALVFRPGKRREAFLGVFGPLSLLGLFAAWIIALTLAFALVHWGMKTPVQPRQTFEQYLYVSGCNLFTLGYDLSSSGPIGRALGWIEGGIGFAFLAVIISYLPVLYQAYSRREVTISLLDARAGSPPSALQFLLRLARAGSLADSDRFLAEWEAWTAELLESHLSFPALSYYRSQHDNQSWLATLTMILDASALMMVLLDRRNPYQSRLTFAMARHAAVDLTLILKTRPGTTTENRFPPEQRLRVQRMLREAGADVADPPDADAKLTQLRKTYEPFIDALALQFLFAIPPIAPEAEPVDNWQRSAWMPRAPGFYSVAAPQGASEEHF